MSNFDEIIRDIAWGLGIGTKPILEASQT